jgi:predicted CoA-binding protein
MTMMELAKAFLAERRIALIGVSREPKDFSRMVLRELLKRGYDVVPVSPALAGTVAGGEPAGAVAGGEPAGAMVEGRRAVASLAGLTPPVAGALFLTPPRATAAAVQDALAAGVRRLWLHRGGGPGASSPEALAACRAAGVVPVTGLCPFMALPDAGWFHGLHRLFRREARATEEATA